MRFPRNVERICRPLDVAPFAGVFFLLLIFLSLNTALISTPGLRVSLPQGPELAGLAGPLKEVVVDAMGNLYYDKQIRTEADLKACLREAVQAAGDPLTLVVRADQAVRYDTLVRLGLLAREAGIHEVLLATQPPLARELNPSNP